MATLREARGTEPALLLDDVFAELDGERQTRLAASAASARRTGRCFSPRRGRTSCREELELPVWSRDGASDGLVRWRIEA